MAGKKKPFRKILYEQQNFPQNYVEDNFLQEVVENENIVPYDYWLCVQETGAVVQQISLVVVFGIIFFCMQNNLIPVSLVLISILLSLLGGNLLLVWFGEKESWWMVFGGQLVKSSSLVVSIYGLSPVLRTLTISYSSDTIIAMVVFFVIIHLYTHDYAFMNGYTSTFNCALSLNSIIFAATICASQLPTPLHAFSLISLSILLFALFPVLRHHMKVRLKFKVAKKSLPEYESFSYDLLTLIMVLSTTTMLAYIHSFAAWIHIFTLTFITFIIPWWLMTMQQKYKYNVTSGAGFDTVLITVERFTDD